MVDIYIGLISTVLVAKKTRVMYLLPSLAHKTLSLAKMH